MGWLLLIQALVLGFFSIYHFVILQFGPLLVSTWWRDLLSGQRDLTSIYSLFIDLFAQASVERSLSTLVESIFLLLLALLAFMAAIGFFLQKKASWILAMFVQGCVLALALIIYLIKTPLHTYFLMAYGVLMVVYLQHADIYKSFQSVKIFAEE
jgi:hypothetical protein